MKVICRKTISPGSGKDLKGESPWLTLDKEYVVLGLKIEPLSGIHILIQSDHHNIPIFPSLLGFEVTSQQIPVSWIIQNDEGVIYMLPKCWAYDSFLDDVENDVPEAWELFKKEAAIMYAEEGFVLQNTH